MIWVIWFIGWVLGILLVLYHLIKVIPCRIPKDERIPFMIFATAVLSVFWPLVIGEEIYRRAKGCLN